MKDFINCNDNYIPGLSNNVLDGDWQVVINAPKFLSPNFWYIYNTKTGKYKRIGKVGGRINYYDRAFEIATQLNERINNHE